MIFVRDRLFNTLAVGQSREGRLFNPTGERAGMSSVLIMRDGQRLSCLEIRSVVRDRIADALGFGPLSLPMSDDAS